MIPLLLDQCLHFEYQDYAILLSFQEASIRPFCVREKVQSPFTKLFNWATAWILPWTRSSLSSEAPCHCWTAALMIRASFFLLGQSQPPWKAHPFVLIKDLAQGSHCISELLLIWMAVSGVKHHDNLGSRTPKATSRISKCPGSRMKVIFVSIH